jgi:predicted dithiol-disulfide oxidoreductase (DUF899 family)
VHVNHRDVTLVAISRAPIEKLEAFKRRMGWNFKWLSSGNNDFNYDYQVSFTPEALENEVEYNYGKQKTDTSDLPGVSVFYQDSKGNLFHTYSAYSRGIDILNPAYNYLDLVPKGRDEAELGVPLSLEPKRTLRADCPNEFFWGIGIAKRPEVASQDRIVHCEMVASKHVKMLIC